MAIYHCRLKIFSRSNGHSAVAAAAYRSGSVLCDERAGKTHRYDRRSGVKETFILAPGHAPKNFSDRAALWNAVEASETRKNSCVARELILALPHELCDAARADLTKDMASWLLKRYRVAVDSAIHEPTGDDDARNHHAHLLFTTREVTPAGLGAKTRILDDRASGKEETEIIREVWEALANEALKSAGLPEVQIDRRTLEEQGIDRIPQTHIGPVAGEAKWEERNERQSDDSEDQEEEGRSEGGSQGGSGGGFGAGQASSQNKEDEGEGDTGSGDGDAVALKLQSKAKTDENGRIIDYKAIDQGRTRKSFVAQIKALNERRAAFGEQPLKDQIKTLDRLMDKLDHRLEQLQKLDDKTSLPTRLMNGIKRGMQAAVKLLHIRQESRAVMKLSESEDKQRQERQTSRYGRSYKKGLHVQIKEMKSNIQTLERKQKEYVRYSAFVQSLEKEISKHAPSAFPSKKQPEVRKDDRVRKITNHESSLKLKLKASVMKESLPPVFKPQNLLKPSLELKGLSSKIYPNTELQKAIIKETHSIDTHRPTKNHSPENSNLTKDTVVKSELKPKLELKPTAVSVPQKLKVPNAKLSSNIRIKEYYMKNYPPPVKESEYRKPLKTHIPAIQKEMERRGPYSVPTETEIKLARSVGMKNLKGMDLDKPPAKKVSNRDAVRDLKSRSETLRKDVPEQYRAKSDKASEYLDKTKKPESLKDHHTDKAQPKHPSKMTGAFNKDLKQQGGKRAIDVDKEKGPDLSHMDSDDPNSDIG